MEKFVPYSIEDSSSFEGDILGDVKAGFPSPAEEIREKLDLIKLLVKHRASTFFFRVSGVSMVDAAMDIDTLEILNVSRKALDEFSADNVISLPSWENVAAASIRPMYEPLAMAGFLGDSNVDETADEEIEEDDE